MKLSHLAFEAIRVRVVLFGPVVLAAGLLAGCGANSLTCPTPQRQANGSFYVPPMSKSCEKLLVTYDHHKHKASTPTAKPTKTKKRSS